MIRLLPILGLAVALVAMPGEPRAQAPETEKPAGAVRSIRIGELRDFGYFPGDVIRREIYVSVDPAYRLQAASVPREGALAYWLDLRGVAVAEDEEGGERRYRLTLDYQSFYVPLTVTRRELPGFTLDFARDKGEGEGMAEARIPGWSFLMSPLREVESTEAAGDPAERMKPNRAPRLQDMSGANLALIGSGLALALTLIAIAYDRAWGPFRHRPARPFTAAARRIKSYLPGTRPDAYRDGLLVLHRAFDEAAGHRVFAGDLPELIAERDELAPYEDEIGRFFASSRQTFFRNEDAAPSDLMPLAEVARLTEKLGAAERAR